MEYLSLIGSDIHVEKKIRCGILVSGLGLLIIYVAFPTIYDINSGELIANIVEDFK